MPKKSKSKQPASKSSAVRVKGKKIIITLAGKDLEAAITCLKKSGSLTLTFAELRIREFPTDMAFVANGESGTREGDGGDGGDGDGDGDGGGYDID